MLMPGSRPPWHNWRSPNDEAKGTRSQLAIPSPSSYYDRRSDWTLELTFQSFEM